MISFELCVQTHVVLFNFETESLKGDIFKSFKKSQLLKLNAQTLYVHHLHKHACKYELAQSIIIIQYTDT